MISLEDIRSIRSREALAQLITDRFEGDYTAFVDDLDRSVNILLRSDLKKAVRLADRAYLLRSYLPKELSFRCIAVQGRVCHWTGRHREALAAYRRAWRLCGKQRDWVNRARLGRGLMDVHMYLGRHAEALRVGRDSLALFHRRGMQRDAAMVMTNIGNVYHRLDNSRMALRYYDRAREIMAPEGGVSLAIVEYNRANIFANMNRFDEARSLYESAAALYGDAGMGIAENQAKYSLAYLYFLEDRFSEAMRMLEQTQHAFRRLGDQKSATVAQLDLCELDVHLNQYGAAIMAADGIIPELHRLGMRYEEAKAHFLAARARLALGDLRPAARLLRRAETLFRKEGNQLWLGMVELARCQLCLQQDQPARAMRAAAAALWCFTRSHDERRIMDAKAMQVRALLAADQPDSALTLARRLLRGTLVGYQRQEILWLVGRALTQRGDDGEAAGAFASAIEQLEKMLLGLYPDEIRFFYVLDKFSLYRETAECLGRLGRADQALSINLVGLRLANERIPALMQTAGKRIPAEFLAERNRLRVLLRRQSNLPQADSMRPAGVTYGRDEQRLWRVDRRIRAYRGTTAAAQRRDFRSEGSDPHRFLRSDESLLLLTASPEGLRAYVAADGRTSILTPGVPLDHLRVLSRKLHFVFERSVQARHQSEQSIEAAQFYLRELHRLIMTPLAATVRTRKLIVICDPSVPPVPFGLLQNGCGEYLMDEHELSFIVNPDDLAARASGAVDFGSCTNAVFAAASRSIPAAEDEGRRLHALFPSAGYYSPAESIRANVFKELKRVDGFFHIAAHASCDSENPLFSRVLLADGPLFPYDLFHQGIRASLITLSGCQTAAPGLYFGSSFSLSKSFYQAGGRWVVASQWPVSDKLSMVFMVDFYERLRRTNDVRQAYVDAVRSLREATIDPALWGSFVLLGL